jgi:hypothetical protein
MARFSGLCCNRSRRAFLADLGLGFTGMALGAMLERDGIVRAAQTAGQLLGLPIAAPKANRVI